MNKVPKQDVINLLLDNISIKLTNDLQEPYKSLVEAGFANYDGQLVSKNWKTKYWKEPIYIEPEPITSRFEILDL